MAFEDDGGGFAFSCDDAKFSICASTWGTRLSQISKSPQKVLIMTNSIDDVLYIADILRKSLGEVRVLANSLAKKEAELLKKELPTIRIALHPTNNAKIVLVSPNTVWISSADFGRSKIKMIESAVGIHSHEVFNKALNVFFEKAWAEATELP